MALTPAQRKANEKYIKSNYDSVSVRWPRAFCERVRAAAAENGESLAGYVRKSIEARMEKDLQKNASSV